MTIYIDEKEQQAKLSYFIIPAKNKREDRHVYRMATNRTAKILYSKRAVPELSKLSIMSGATYPVHTSLMTAAEKKWNLWIGLASWVSQIMFTLLIYAMVVNFNMIYLIVAAVYLYLTFRNGKFEVMPVFFSRDTFLLNIAENNPTKTKFQMSIEDFGQFRIKDMDQLSESFELLRLKAEVNGYGYAVSTPVHSTLNEYATLMKQYYEDLSNSPIMTFPLFRSYHQGSERYIEAFDILANMMSLERGIGAWNKSFNSPKSAPLSLVSDMEIELLNKKLEYNEVKGRVKL